MKIVRVLFWMLLITLAALAALAAAIAYLPVYLEDNRGVLEAGATKALGRPVEIDGVSLAWSLHPLPSLSVALDGPRVRNPDWARGPLLARAERLDLQFSLSALLERRIEIAGLVIRGAVVHLESGAGGKNNWSFGDDDSDSGTDPGLRIPSVRVLDSTISYQPEQGEAWQAAIARLHLTGLGDLPLALDASLRMHDVPLSITASAGDTDGSSPPRWPFEIGAQAGETETTIRGSTTARLDPTAFEADVQLKGETPAPLGKLLGIDGVPDAPFALNTRVTRSGPDISFADITGSIPTEVLPNPVILTGGSADLKPDGEWATDLAGKVGDLPTTIRIAHAAKPDTATDDKPPPLAITLTVADHSFDGQLRPASDGTRAMISGKLALGEIRPEEIKKSAFVAAAPSNQTAATAKRAGTGAPSEPASDRTSPVAALTRFDADLTISAKVITWQRITAKELAARAQLSNGRLQLERISAALPGLPVTGKASLDVGAKPPTLVAALRAARVDLPQALTMLTDPPKIDGVIDKLDLTLEAAGETPTAMIDSLGGKASAAAARFTPTGNKATGPKEVRLKAPAVTIKPGQTTSLRAGLLIGQQAFDLTLTGGAISDLLPGRSSWKRVELAANGKLNGETIEVKGHLRPLNAILAGQNLQLDLKGSHGGNGEKLTARVKGMLARLDGLAGSRLSVEASGQSLAVLDPIVQTRLPAQPFKAEARLEGHQQRLDLLHLKASSADSDIEGQIRIDLGPKPRIDATLASRVLDLTPYLVSAEASAGSGSAGDPGAPTTGLDFRSGADPIRPMQLDFLKALDGELHWSAGHARINEFGVDDAKVDATLDTGHLILLASAGQERLIANVELRPQRTQWRVDLHHKGKLDLSWLFEAEDSRALSKVPTTIDLRLSGVGDTLPSLISSANGRLELVLGAGQLDPAVSDLPLGGVLITLLNTLGTVDLSKEAAGLKCAVLQFNVADGIATSKRGLAVQTENFNVLGGGAINLQTNEIELHFKTAKRKGLGINLLGIADKFIYISGTLDDPRAALDAGGLLVHGGAAWASGGLSLLYDQLFKRLTAKNNPCDMVLRKGGGR